MPFSISAKDRERKQELVYKRDFSYSSVLREKRRKIK